MERVEADDGYAGADRETRRQSISYVERSAERIWPGSGEKATRFATKRKIISIALNEQ